MPGTQHDPRNQFFRDFDDYLVRIRKLERKVATTEVGGGDSTKHVLAVWGGTLPDTIGTGQVWRVPTAADGSSLTFGLTRAFARLEDAGDVDVTFVIEKSAGGGAFVGTTITTLTVVAGDYEVEDTAIADAITSGDLLRIAFAAVGFDTIYDVELIGATT